jgi:hypothetical protein
MAVGTSYSTDGDQFTLAERRRDSVWTIEPTPVISGMDFSELSGVSCSGPRSCAAVGYTVTSRSDSVVRALAEQWNGSSWTVEPTPLPAGSDLWVTLAGVSCVGPDFCIAVGGYFKNEDSGEELPLAEQWNGTSWYVLTAPNTHAENGSSFTSASCVAPNVCEVTGEYDYADIGQAVIAYGYNGSDWVSQRQVNPVGQEFNSDNALSCTGGASCMSVGSWINNAPLALAEYWDGSSWSRLSVLRPRGSAPDELNGVSCAGTATCSAVGDSGRNQNDYPTFTLAEEWNGTSWQNIATPNPVAASSSLAAVSCTGPAMCVAVGSSSSRRAGATLVEIYSR